MLRISTILYSVLVFVLMMPSVNAVSSDTQYVTATTEVIEDTEVIVDVKPNTLHANSNGQYVTCYITPVEGYLARDIDVNTVKLEGVGILPDQYGYVDINLDGICELMVKFDKTAILEQLPTYTCHDYPVTITGSFLDGLTFVGTDLVHIVYR